MYLPGIETIEGQSAGAMAGGRGRKLLLHSTEGSTIEGAVAAYRARNVWPHLTVDCHRRRAVQHLPLQLAGRSLKNKAGGVETNRAGQYLVQIELVGFAQRPETIGDTDDLDWFARTVVRPIHEATGIPLYTQVTWVPYPASYGEGAAQRVPAYRWADLSGIVGHQHAPENDHGDPGALDVARIIATASNPQEDDMALTEAEYQRINSIAVTAAWGAVQRLGQYLARGQGNAAFNPNLQTWMSDKATTTLPQLAGAVAGVGGAVEDLEVDADDIDETAIAQALVAALTAGDIAQALIDAGMAKAVVDELHHRTAPAPS